MSGDGPFLGSDDGTDSVSNQADMERNRRNVFLRTAGGTVVDDDPTMHRSA